MSDSMMNLIFAVVAAGFVFGALWNES